MLPFATSLPIFSAVSASNNFLKSLHEIVNRSPRSLGDIPEVLAEKLDPKSFYLDLFYV